MPPEVMADLSWGQQIGFKMLKALEVGSVPPSLQKMMIGPTDHSRWLTTANRYVTYTVYAYQQTQPIIHSLICLPMFA